MTIFDDDPIAGPPPAEYSGTRGYADACMEESDDGHLSRPRDPARAQGQTEWHERGRLAGAWESQRLRERIAALETAILQITSVLPQYREAAIADALTLAQTKTPMGLERWKERR